MADYQPAAPSQCPAQFKTSVALLHRDAVLILDSFAVPYSVQAALADDGYVRISDLADRYSDSKEVRAAAPRELGFKDGDNNFDSKTFKFVAMRLAQAVDQGCLIPLMAYTLHGISQYTLYHGCHRPLYYAGARPRGERHAPGALEAKDRGQTP